MCVFIMFAVWLIYYLKYNINGIHLALYTPMYISCILLMWYIHKCKSQQTVKSKHTHYDDIMVHSMK